MDPKPWRSEREKPRFLNQRAKRDKSRVLSHGELREKPRFLNPEYLREREARRAGEGWASGPASHGHTLSGG